MTWTYSYVRVATKSDSVHIKVPIILGEFDRFLSHKKCKYFDFSRFRAGVRTSLIHNKQWSGSEKSKSPGPVTGTRACLNSSEVPIQVWRNALI